MTEELKMDSRGLAIRLNNVATNDPCAICGQRTDPDLGPELFLSDREALVCYECGWKIAPELVAMLNIYRTNLHLFDRLKESLDVFSF